MSVIGHQNISVNLTFVSFRGLTERAQIQFVIGGLEEHRLAVHATLDYVLRNIRDEVARLTRHKYSNADDELLNI